MRKEKPLPSLNKQSSGRRGNAKKVSPENAFNLMEEIERLTTLADQVSEKIHDEPTLDNLLKALDVLGKNSTRINSLIKNLGDGQINEDNVETFHQFMAQMIEDLKKKAAENSGYVDGAADNPRGVDILPARDKRRPTPRSKSTGG